VQLLFLDRVPAYAAINESVELAKRANPRAAAFVNAILRRASREAKGLLDQLDDDDPAAAATLHSVPPWLAALWFAELGAREARALLRAVNEPGESALRVNTLLASVEDVVARLPVMARPAPGISEGLVLDGPFDAHGSELFEQGAIMPQSRGSMSVSRELAPASGERILDLCAAPGAKTTHLAALTSDEGEIVAVERHPGRARALAQTCQRMRAGSVRVEVADAAEFRADRPFDRVLVDPPCSGLGTLQSRPDIRWRASPDSITQLAALQRQILEAAVAALSPGGTIVYSVCTISKAESSGLIARFLAEHPDLVMQSERQLLPHRDHTDGFYIARLRRE
jgi:16S rRNA (cytosine967-C5)-methyltransferase